MMYMERFVAVLKAGGKILREVNRTGGGATVLMPFGSEYSLLLKNLNSRRALARVTIDGQDVLGGRGIIVPANGQVEIERFIDRLDRGNRFRFIEKTDRISEHRGDFVDDGIVRVEWQFEAQAIQPTYVYPTWQPPTVYGGALRSAGIDGRMLVGNSIGASQNAFSCQVDGAVNAVSATYTSSGESKAVNMMSDEGITVKGSESKQTFTHGSIGFLEAEVHVVALMIRGCQGKALTVKEKVMCPTCGAHSKSSSRFCQVCGTALAAAVA